MSLTCVVCKEKFVFLHTPVFGRSFGSFGLVGKEVTNQVVKNACTVACSTELLDARLLRIPTLHSGREIFTFLSKKEEDLKGIPDF